MVFPFFQSFDCIKFVQQNCSDFHFAFNSSIWVDCHQFSQKKRRSQWWIRIEIVWERESEKRIVLTRKWPKSQSERAYSFIRGIGIWFETNIQNVECLRDWTTVPNVLCIDNSIPHSVCVCVCERVNESVGALFIQCESIEWRLAFDGIVCIVAIKHFRLSQ